jgi:hypothetical protein
MVGFVFAAKHREKEMEVPTKEGRSAHKDSEEAHSSVVGCVGGACRRWRGIRSEHPPGTLLRQCRGDHPGKDDTLRAEGVDGLVGRWLGDAEDPGEPPD